MPGLKRSASGSDHHIRSLATTRAIHCKEGDGYRMDMRRATTRAHPAAPRLCPPDSLPARPYYTTKRPAWSPVHAHPLYLQCIVPCGRHAGTFKSPALLRKTLDSGALGHYNRLWKQQNAFLDATCRCSSVVEQRFCKPLARSSNLLIGSNKPRLRVSKMGFI